MELHRTIFLMVRRIILLLIGSIFVAFGLELFMIPNQIIDGGVVGIAMILSHLTGNELGIFLFLLNLPFLLIGYKQIGKTFTLSTLFAVSSLSFTTYFLHSVPATTDDPLLGAVFGGMIVGVGVGLIIRNGGSLDGTEITAILFNKKIPFSVGETVMFFNIFILGSAGFVFGWEQAMYSLIAYFVAFKMIDIVIEGLNESKSVWIISDKHQDLGEAILARLGRGVTYLKGEGGYTGDDKKVIFCIITRLEEAKLKSMVEEIDPQAFLAVGNIHDIKGGRFKKKNIH